MVDCTCGPRGPTGTRRFRIVAVEDKSSFYQTQASPEQAQALERVSDVMSRAFSVIIDVAPNCRERSLALTKLEEVGMWASKAITHGRPNG